MWVFLYLGLAFVIHFGVPEIPENKKFLEIKDYRRIGFPYQYFEDGI
jgi:hypothetical protein